MAASAVGTGGVAIACLYRLNLLGLPNLCESWSENLAQSYATVDHAQVDRWWLRHPDASPEPVTVTVGLRRGLAATRPATGPVGAGAVGSR